MNAVVAAAESAATSAGLWRIAARAAGRRRMTIGALPIPLPMLAASTASISALTQAPDAAIIVCAGVAVAAWVDARTGSIFDPLTAAVAIASIALCALQGAALAGILGSIAVGAVLLLLHLLTNGRGLGFGDVKLGAALGMGLGASAGLTAIGLAFVFGGAYGVWLLASRRATARSAIRFAPFIAAGTFTTLAIPALHP